MAAIEYSPTLYSTCLVLTKEEALRIKPLIARAYKKECELHDEYKSRHESGYSTALEETLMMKHDDAARELKVIADEIEHLINY